MREIRREAGASSATCRVDVFQLGVDAESAVSRILFLTFIISTAPALRLVRNRYRQDRSTPYSEATREELAGQKRPVHFRQAVTGALEALTYSGRPVESIPEFRLTPEDLSQFETLVLPEVEVVRSAQAEVISDWVKKGGTLLATGKCGLVDEKGQSRSNFPLADVFGVDLVSEERKYACDASGKFKEGVVSILPGIDRPCALQESWQY